MADENLSGVPPVVTLSGLQGVPSFSGASQQAPASGMSGYGTATPGMEGGPDLLSLLLAQAGQGGAGDTGVGALTPFTAGSLGQQTGGLSAGAFGQQGQGGIAGATGQTAGGASAGTGTTDPLSILQKLLGLGSKAAGAAGGLFGGASPTIGDTGGTSLSDQVRSQQGQPGASPQPGVLTLGATSPTASPTVSGDVNAPGLPPGFQDPNALGGLPEGGGQTPGTQNITITNPNANPQLQGLYDSLKGAGFSDADILPILQQAGGAQGFSAGEIPGGGASIPSGVSGAPTASPTSLSGTGGGVNGFGAAQSGLSGGAGLINLIQSLQSGNVPGAVGGGLQAVGGGAGALSNLGVGGLSSIGAGAGGLGGLLSIIQGIRGLGQGETAGQATQSIGGGSLGVYQALSTLFPDVFPSLTGALGSGLSAALPGLTETLATQAPQVASDVASIGGSAGAGIAALPVAAISLAEAISGMMDTNKAAAGAQQAYRKLTSSIPGAEQELGKVPGIVSQLGPNTTPQQAQDILAQLNTSLASVDDQTGLIPFLRSGGTLAQGGQSGQDVSINFPQGPSLLQALSPYMAAASLGEVRAEDILGRSGMSAQQLQGLPGYLAPLSAAMTLGPGQFNQVFNPSDPLVGSGLNLLGSAEPNAYGAGYQMSPEGYLNTQLLGNIQGLQPGGYEQGLANLFQGYGGIGGGNATFGGFLNPLGANAPAMAGLPTQAPQIIPSVQTQGLQPTPADFQAKIQQAQAARQYDPSIPITPEEMALQYGIGYGGWGAGGIGDSAAGGIGSGVGAAAAGAAAGPGGGVGDGSGGVY